MNRVVEIQGRPIGPGHPTYLVAEMSANNHRDFDQAVEILKAAHAAGADAVKLQTYTAETLTIESDTSLFRIQGTLWDGRTLAELYREAATPWEWQPELKRIADGLGIHLFSTPFDRTAVDFLEAMRVPAHKIASFEAIDLQLLRRVAATGKPVILSTGMCSLAEVEEAVHTIEQAGGKDLILLKCTSAYPAPPEAVNLRTIGHLAQAFGIPVGLSDHTKGAAVAVAAVACGACLIEKHLTLSRAAGGPDSAFSAEPDEFRLLVESVRTAENALGEVKYGVGDHERSSLVFRRSLFVVEDVKGGDVLSTENVRSIRPGYGLHPRYLDEVIGRYAICDIPRGTPLSWELIGGRRGAQPARGVSQSRVHRQ